MTNKRNQLTERAILQKNNKKQRRNVKSCTCFIEKTMTLLLHNIVNINSIREEICQIVHNMEFQILAFRKYSIHLIKNSDTITYQHLLNTSHKITTPSWKSTFPLYFFKDWLFCFLNAIFQSLKYRNSFY